MPQEEEIDLVEVVQKLWKNRKRILKITVVFMVLGVLVAAIEVVDDARLKISGNPIRFLFTDFNGTIISLPGSIFVRFPLQTASVPFGYNT